MNWLKRLSQKTYKKMDKERVKQILDKHRIAPDVYSNKKVAELASYIDTSWYKDEMLFIKNASFPIKFISVEESKANHEAKANTNDTDTP